MERIVLSDHALATYDAGDGYDHGVAAGFVNVFGLPVELAARKASDACRKKLRVAT